MKENLTLTLLDLSYNAIGNVDADALAKGLRENSTLTLLELFRNAIGNAGADALAQRLKKIFNSDILEFVFQCNWRRGC